MSGVLPLADVRDEAVHGAFCPKMCNYACPVLGATGRQGAAPWGLHVSVAALAADERGADAATYHALRGCTGCHACRQACVYDLDVPAEVRAARAEVVERGGPIPAVESARAAVAQRRAPHGAPLATAVADSGRATVVLVAGCYETPETTRAAVRLVVAAGHEPAVLVPDGCCGALFADLGDRPSARRAGEQLADQLEAVGGGDARLVALDPHCLPALRAVADEVTDVASFVAGLVHDRRIEFEPASEPPVTYHDPCLLARDEQVIDPPRQLLAAVGAQPTEPEGSRERTVCSGAGMAFPLVDAQEAAATARRRWQALDAAAPTVVTACARAGQHLAAHGGEVVDLLSYVAAHLPGERR